MIRSLAIVLAVATATASAAQQQPAQQQQAPQPPQQQGAAGRQLTIDEAVRLALERNYDIQRQTLLTLSSEQDRIIARSVILPNLNFNASLGTSRIGAGDLFVNNVKIGDRPTQVSQNYSVGLQLRQLVFDGGKWWNNISAAELGLSASKASLDEQRLQTAYLVEQRFYELVRSQRQLQVLAEAAARSRDQADFVQRLFEGGRSTQADVYAARANRDNDEVQRLGAERNVELARTDLATAIGFDPSQPLAVAEPAHIFDEPAQAPAAQEAVARAWQNRPSLKAAQLTTEASRKQASAARGDYWPTVSLVGSYNRGTNDFSATYTDDPRRNSQLSAGVNLSWNIFSGFQTQAQARKADIQALLSENDFVNARNNVASDVQKAVAQLSTARAQARVANQTEDNARENLRLAKARQQVGVGTQLEVRDAELKLTQAQLSRVGAHIDGREAEAALRRAQGG